MTPRQRPRSGKSTTKVKGDVYFLQVSYVAQLHPAPSSPLLLRDAEGNVLEWRYALQSERQRHPLATSVMGVVRKVSLGGKPYEALRDMAVRRWTLPPIDGSQSVDWRRSDGSLVDGKIVPCREYPTYVRQTVEENALALLSAGQRMLGAMRWRGGVFVERPMVVGGEQTHLSLDAKSWQPLANCLAKMWIPDQSTEVKIDQDVLQQATDAWRSEQQVEPLGHEMLHEARLLANTSPRSSIVLAVAAVEVGYKRMTDELVPSQLAMVDDHDTPPLDTLLRDHLPTLPIKSRATLHGPLVPPELVGDLLVAVNLRNEIVHRGRAAPAPERVETTLRAVRDALWLFDVFRGYDWAGEFLSSACREAMGLPKVPPPLRGGWVYVTNPPTKLR